MMCYKHRYCVKHAEQLLQLLEETQPTSITTCNTTIKTYKNNSKLMLATINYIINNMETLVFVYLSQVISSSQYLTVLLQIFLISLRPNKEVLKLFVLRLFRFR